MAGAMGNCWSAEAPQAGQACTLRRDTREPEPEQVAATHGVQCARTWLGAWMETASVDCSARRPMRRMALGTPTVLMVMWRAPANGCKGEARSGGATSL